MLMTPFTLVTAPGSCDESVWPDKDHGLICGECKVLVDNFDSTYQTCDGYCASIGKTCVGAWEEDEITDTYNSPASDIMKLVFTSDSSETREGFVAQCKHRTCYARGFERACVCVRTSVCCVCVFVCPFVHFDHAPSNSIIF